MAERGARRCGAPVRLRVVLLVLFALRGAATGAEPAYLERPSTAVTGTDLLGYPGLVSGRKAEYVRREAAGLRGLWISPSLRRPAERLRRIVVLYSRAALPAEADWAEYPGAALRLLRVPSDGGLSLLYRDAAGFSMLFSFEEDFGPMGAFCAALVKGFKEFLPYAATESEAPFPAVVELD